MARLGSSEASGYGLEEPGVEPMALQLVDNLV